MDADERTSILERALWQLLKTLKTVAFLASFIPVSTNTSFNRLII